MKYVKPTMNIVQWEDEVFLLTSSEVAAEDVGIFKSEWIFQNN